MIKGGCMLRESKDESYRNPHSKKHSDIKNARVKRLGDKDVTRSIVAQLYHVSPATFGSVTVVHLPQKL